MIRVLSQIANNQPEVIKERPHFPKTTACFAMRLSRVKTSISPTYTSKVILSYFPKKRRLVLTLRIEILNGCSHFNNLLILLQEGTDKYDTFEIAVLADNESIVMAGHTFGNWSGVNKGGSDFAAVKLDTSLNAYQWRWQVRCLSLRSPR